MSRASRVLEAAGEIPKAAQAQGFDIVAHHATARDFENFADPHDPSSRVGRGSTYFAITPEKALAGAYGGAMDLAHLAAPAEPGLATHDDVADALGIKYGHEDRHYMKLNSDGIHHYTIGLEDGDRYKGIRAAIRKRYPRYLRKYYDEKGKVQSEVGLSDPND